MPKFNVEKSILVNVSVEQAYQEVLNFHNWPTWVIAEPNSKGSVSPDGLQNSWEGDIIGAGFSKGPRN